MLDLQRQLERSQTAMRTVMWIPSHEPSLARSTVTILNVIYHQAMPSQIRKMRISVAVLILRWMHLQMQLAGVFLSTLRRVVT